MIYVITGHLGSGKSLLAVRIAHDYLREGKRIASNITIKAEELMGSMSEAVIIKLPYVPTAEHLFALGDGYEGPYSEDRFGLIILDEAGSWLNSRDWNEKGRRELFQWITHARKYGWDVALLVQDFEALDAQIRRSVTEVYVRCTRLDRIRIPYTPFRLPRLHMGAGRYGGPMGEPYKRWIARGNDYFRAFNTREVIRMENMYTDAGIIDMRANVSLLSPWHLVGRYKKNRFSVFALFELFLRWSLILLASAILAPARPPRGAGRGSLSEHFRSDLRSLKPVITKPEVDPSYASQRHLL